MPNSNVYSGKEFALYVSHDVAADPGVGNFNTNTGSQWSRIDIDSVSFPAFNPTQEFEMRSGRGRVASIDTMFTSDKGVVRELSIAGRLTADVYKIFMENALGESTDEEYGDIDIAYNHSPATVSNGDEITSGDYHQTLSFYLEAPIDTSEQGFQLAGCVVTAFAVTSDMGTAAGRFNFSATVQTGFDIAQGETSGWDAPSINSTSFFLSDMEQMQIEDNTGGEIFTAEDDTDVLLPLVNSFGWNIESPSKMLGMTDNAGSSEPQVIARQIPELNISWSANIKYDDASAALINEYRETDHSLTLRLSDDLDGSTFNQDVSGATFGVISKFTKLQGAEFSGDDVASINLTGKCAASGTNTDVVSFQIQEYVEP